MGIVETILEVIQWLVSCVYIYIYVCVCSCDVPSRGFEVFTTVYMCLNQKKGGP